MTNTASASIILPPPLPITVNVVLPPPPPFATPFQAR
jgi:hypothetical protein